MSTVYAYAANSATEPLAKTTITRREVGPHDVAFDIHFAGICHSDIHTVKAEWGTPNYPVVAGHEIAGVVTAVGSEVTKYKVGDHVGVGCFVDSCRECDNCKAGLQQYCTDGGMIGTYNATERDGTPTYGGYSGAIVVDENYVLRIPDSIPLDKAAPLLCAGVTLYSPLRHWNAGPGKKIAVIGLGGLGHMGVKLAHAMGAHVTVLSQSLKKMEDGLRLGADEYYATSDPDTFSKLSGRFDLIVNTVSANLDLGAYLSLLKTDGTLVELGAPEKPLVVPFFPLGAMRRSLSGSMIGGIPETQEMLDFCAEHDVTPEIEVIQPDYINEAYERVLASDVRYRFVIDTASLRG
ncbi:MULTISPECIES: NAD(P)-dependent alcohol dehydrogenase [unclassified Mycolicibacterium]|uniref:NAD(P)-dependent alcohol dehydrogenase n=1 Tax=unclassified Mycolicibacterium TaxID=2636767 RepID=UPI0012DDE15A|nr:MULTISPECIES: NAD(P)-dependent alcohol dehydrogenase [unclassified Mycolicibacterium]MUL80661.1 NAD(P)-dependent alcohol dehydrogenase [Mycolicibacterium sp. CBMA 329]MUL86428.1 NAD(P)-dependent alcohol dehydrogenase [Mycolicibacterium sp. CBMA 331]MUM01290.1 NAD(P)-dependent alcohol dehydrogenase [Mycolicibacterium sp. CBMA 334]MUM29025.1 NAD(P)-dependent alcohol dehydrogenase [Mycolicibacterium sp. CBMA 295]MUM36724.1 NAD(P)-dependent alcohol dehydrogenase [Mycolicibacterium sp. CBMA 247]